MILLEESRQAAYPFFTEDFLQFVWKFGLFNQNELTTTEGERIQILDRGQHNDNAGPDFLDGKIKIGETLWAGNIEIHKQASDWTKHKHTGNKQYNNVVLHVVFEEDEAIVIQGEYVIPCLEMKGRIANSLVEKYLTLVQNSKWIPCAYHVRKVPALKIYSWLDRLAIERLERRSVTILLQLKRRKGSWDQLFFELIGERFGLKVNKMAFQMLVSLLPITLVLKYRTDELSLFALVFGMAGFLEDTFEEEYPKALQKEFQFLKQKHKLKPLPKTVWKFSRLRPFNFPTIRLAQFAGFLMKNGRCFRQLVEIEVIEDCFEMFDFQLPAYWNTHLVFGQETKQHSRYLSGAFRELLILNAFIPCLYAYGQYVQEDRLQERAIDWEELLKKEENSVVRKWQTLGLGARSALDTQALLELKSEYCDHTKCLTCGIGNAILGG